MGRDLEPVACCQDRLPEAVKSRRVESEDMLHNATKKGGGGGI